jgi:hypothetical protein
MLGFLYINVSIVQRAVIVEMAVSQVELGGVSNRNAQVIVWCLADDRRPVTTGYTERRMLEQRTEACD